MEKITAIATWIIGLYAFFFIAAKILSHFVWWAPPSFFLLLIGFIAFTLVCLGFAE